VIKNRPPRVDLIYFDQPVYFITFCTRNRRRIPSLGRAQSVLEKYARNAIEKFSVAVGRYVLMPDHVHFFLCGDDSFLLSPWVGGLKRAISVALDAQQLWQPGFFDHILRSDESYEEKWEYVRDNPVRAGLVEKPEKWRFQGEIVLIDRA
jgi:REP element-mobilizing transposase RayT